MDDQEVWLRILHILAEERDRGLSSKLDAETMSERLETLSLDEVQHEITYLEEKGYIDVSYRQIGGRIFTTIHITAEGVDCVKGRTPPSSVAGDVYNVTFGDGADRIVIGRNAHYTEIVSPPVSISEAQETGSSGGGGESKVNRISQLHRRLCQLFDEGELRTICFDLDVDYESLPGRGKANKARELIRYLRRRSRVSELEDKVKQLRPNS